MCAGGGTSLSSSRIGYIDALKGFATLCVVLGHVASRYYGRGIYSNINVLLINIYNLIYSFHMPMFMMISGYVYCTAYFDGNGEPDRKRINRRIYDLIGVYMIFGIACGICKILASSVVNSRLTLVDVALIGIRPIEHLWYVYTLIFLYLVFSIKRLAVLNKWMLLGIFFITAVCGQLNGISWFAASFVLYYALFFFMGIAYRKNKNWIIGNKPLTLVLFCTSIVRRELIWDKVDQIFIVRFIVGIMAALGISLTLWYVFEHISFLGNCGIFKLLGRYSFEIYLIHFFLVAGLELVFLKVGINVYVSVFMNFVISTAAPILISKLCYKLNIHGLFFKPFTYLYVKHNGEGKR